MARLLNLLLSVALWRNYKALILSTLLLVVALYAVDSFQSGYVASQLAEKQLDTGYQPPISISASLYIKWGIFGLLALCWFVYNRWRNQVAQALEKNNALAHIMSAKRKAAPAEAPSKPAPIDDPFANIRKKDRLRTEADIVIDRKRHH